MVDDRGCTQPERRAMIDANQKGNGSLAEAPRAAYPAARRRIQSAGKIAYPIATNPSRRRQALRDGEQGARAARRRDASRPHRDRAEPASGRDGASGGMIEGAVYV